MLIRRPEQGEKKSVLISKVDDISFDTTPAPLFILADWEELWEVWRDLETGFLLTALTDLVTCACYKCKINGC